MEKEKFLKFTCSISITRYQFISECGVVVQP